MLQLFVLVVAVPAVTYSMFLDNDPCKIDMWDKSTLAEELTYNESVPHKCQNGTFRWDYPRGVVNLHFPYHGGNGMSVCISQSMFAVQDTTLGRGMALNAQGNDLCTRKQSGDITLHVVAPKSLIYVDMFSYYVNIVK